MARHERIERRRDQVDFYEHVVGGIAVDENGHGPSWLIESRADDPLTVTVVVHQGGPAPDDHD